MIASAVRLYQDHYKITRLSNEADEEAQRMSIKDYYKITKVSNRTSVASAHPYRLKTITYFYGHSRQSFLKLL